MTQLVWFLPYKNPWNVLLEIVAQDNGVMPIQMLSSKCIRRLKGSSQCSEFCSLSKVCGSEEEFPSQVNVSKDQPVRNIHGNAFRRRNPCTIVCFLNWLSVF